MCLVLIVFAPGIYNQYHQNIGYSFGIIGERKSSLCVTNQLVKKDEGDKYNHILVSGFY